VEDAAIIFEVSKEILEYIQTPQYNNFFKQFDKKLTKNLLKRCVIDPLATLVSSHPIKDKALIVALNNLLEELMSVNQLLTPNLKDWLREPLKKYI